MFADDEMSQSFDMFWRYSNYQIRVEVDDDVKIQVTHKFADFNSDEIMHIKNPLISNLSRGTQLLRTFHPSFTHVDQRVRAKSAIKIIKTSIFTNKYRWNSWYCRWVSETSW